MNKSIEVIDLGVIEYGRAWDIQKEYFSERLDGHSAQNLLLYCEHPHVYTLGKSGEAANLLIGEEFLKNIGASYFKTDRGGDITYHGYGQLVGYPIINITDYSISLREYIYIVEEAVIRTIKYFGIEGFRVDGATGVWVSELGAEKKICAIGVKASRYITMHGFALNVDTDLKYFSYINPCGFISKGVTSISNYCKVTGSSVEVDMKQVKLLYAKEFAALLNCEILSER